MSFTVRDIKETDLETIMKWRTDRDITRYMNTDPELTLEKQLKWFDKISNDETSTYWVVEVDSMPAGVISLFNIDRDSGTASWGYYIGEKKLRSLKLAISLEMSLYDYVFHDVGLKELNSETFSLNKEVIKLHIACGSRIISESKGEVIKNNTAYDITHMSISSSEWEKIKLSKKYESIDFNIKGTRRFAWDENLNHGPDKSGNFMQFHHIGYAVSNMDNSVRIMKELDYFQVSDRIKDSKRNIIITFMKKEGTGEIVELVAPIDERSPISNLLNQRKGVGIPYHICYEVKNISDTIQHLQNLKFMLINPPLAAVALENRRVAFLFKKDILIIYLLEKNEQNNGKEI